MAKSVTGGRGIQGMNWSGKENRRATSQTVAGGKTSREMGGWGSGVLAQTPPGTTSRSLASKFSTAYKPGDYAAYRKTLPGFVAVAKGKKPAAPVAVAVKPPAKKPVVVKPAAKKLSPSVLRSALGMAPTKKATPSTKPPATRFGTVTGTKTGTKVSGGGGYGGGGTRGSGSLSGQGSGTRSAGTSRTGGTRGNNPVRG